MLYSYIIYILLTLHNDYTCSNYIQYTLHHLDLFYLCLQPALGGIVPTTRGFDINVDAEQYAHVVVIRCGSH